MKDYSDLLSCQGTPIKNTLVVQDTSLLYSEENSSYIIWCIAIASHAMFIVSTKISNSWQYKKLK